MKNFRKINKQEYEKLLKQAPFSTFFHNPEWHKFLEQKFKWLKFEYYIYKPASTDASQGGDELIFPLAIAGKKLISLPFCEYGGPLFTRRLGLRSHFGEGGSLGVGGPQDVDLKEFEKNVLSEFGNIKIKFHPRIEAGNKNSDVSTHWIENLKNTSEQELLASFRKTLRHEIRDAQERGLEIRKCENQKELRRFYNLYVANLRRKKTIPYPWPLVQFLCKNPSNELLLAIYKGRIIGGDLFLYYSGFVHYFLSASDYKYRNFGTAHLLLWEKLRTLVGKDIIFDLGATPRNSSLNVFKAGWGGTEYPIYQIGIKRSEESLRSSRLRNIWGLMPRFVIRIVSPLLLKYRI